MFCLHCLRVCHVSRQNSAQHCSESRFQCGALVVGGILCLDALLVIFGGIGGRERDLYLKSLIFDLLRILLF